MRSIRNAEKLNRSSKWVTKEQNVKAMNPGIVSLPTRGSSRPACPFWLLPRRRAERGRWAFLENHRAK